MLRAPFTVMMLAAPAACHHDSTAHTPEEPEPAKVTLESETDPSSAKQDVGDPRSEWEQFRKHYEYRGRVVTADPAIRSEQSFQVPKSLIVVPIQQPGSPSGDGQESFVVSVPDKEWESVNVTVGKDMITGFEATWNVVSVDGNGEELREPCGSVVEGSGAAQFKCFLNPGLNWKPVAGRKYAVELRVVLFETDWEANHMWDPHEGTYKELWSKTMRVNISGTR